MQRQHLKQQHSSRLNRRFDESFPILPYSISCRILRYRPRRTEIRESEYLLQIVAENQRIRDLCWMFRWTATDLKEKNRNRKEKKGHLMRIDTEQPGGWRHMVCLSQRHRASLVRGTAYVLRNCTTSLINSIPSQISPTTVLTCKAVPHCVYLHFLTSIEE